MCRRCLHAPRPATVSGTCIDACCALRPTRGSAGHSCVLRLALFEAVGVDLGRPDPLLPPAVLEEELPHVLAEVAFAGVAVGQRGVAKLAVR